MFFFLDYLCKLSDNVYDIEFVKFKIRDFDTNLTLFEVSKSDNEGSGDLIDADDSSSGHDGRFIRYNFSPSFLRLKTIGAT